MKTKCWVSLEFQLFWVKRNFESLLLCVISDGLGSLSRLLFTHLTVQPNFIGRLNDLEGRDSEIAPTVMTRKLGYK